MIFLKNRICLQQQQAATYSRTKRLRLKEWLRKMFFLPKLLYIPAPSSAQLFPYDFSPRETNVSMSLDRTPVGIPCPEAVMVCASICLKASLFFFGGAFSLLPIVPVGGPPGWPPTTITLKDKHEIHAKNRQKNTHEKFRQ